MEDQSLKAYLLPAELIIKNFVKGEIDCNYEKYMLEFVNESEFFRKKANGEIYVAPCSEEDGQCDCNSEKYQLDFKLIASKTVLQAKSILSAGKMVIVKGAYATGEPKVKKKTMKGTRIHAALRDCDFDRLCEIRKNYTKAQGIENDIYELLETLETRKNLLLFFPYKFVFDNAHEFLKGVTMIQEAINMDFQYAMQYRNYVAKEFDTYMAFIYDKHIIFIQEKNNSFAYIDSVELAKSSVFKKLSGYTDVISNIGIY